MATTEVTTRAMEAYDAEYDWARANGFDHKTALAKARVAKERVFARAAR